MKSPIGFNQRRKRQYPYEPCRAVVTVSRCLVPIVSLSSATMAYRCSNSPPAMKSVLCSGRPTRPGTRRQCAWSMECPRGLPSRFCRWIGAVTQAAPPISTAALCREGAKSMNSRWPPGGPEPAIRRGCGDPHWIRLCGRLATSLSHRVAHDAPALSPPVRRGEGRAASGSSLADTKKMASGTVARRP